jgi:hypothetical protein
MEQESLKSELDKKALEIYLRENPQAQDPQIIYSRLSNWRSYGAPHWVGIISQRGSRQYPDERIRKTDRLLVLAILRKVNPSDWALNWVAFNFFDQAKMWEEVFKVKVKRSEKERQIKWLQKLIEQNLAQLSLSDLYE